MKSILIGIQINKQKTEAKIREELNEQLKMYELMDGINSEGWKRVNEEILVLNDNDLKRRAGKYREFLSKIMRNQRAYFFD